MTKIVLNGGSMTVTTGYDINPASPTVSTMPLPANGVVYVDNSGLGSCSGGYVKLSPRVYGAIAQKFRGPVGTGNGLTPSTGYRKEYVYNDRLRYREPPYFLDPVQASWRISRSTEQVPATKP